jgi:hypothetical protein
VVLVASSMLTSLVPPALVEAAPKQPAPPRLVVQGRGAGVRATLEVTPGYPGPNGFRLRAYDTGTSRAVVGEVTLHFQMPARPELVESTLALPRAADGSYAAQGSNISLIGDWSITAMVQRPAGSLDVPFRVTSRPSPQQLQGMTMGQRQMVHGLRLANGWLLEAYLTSGHPGRNALHLIFTDQRNGPVLVPTIPVVTANQGPATRTFQVIRLATPTPTPNHFYAAGTFTAGRWNFQVAAVTGDGTRLTPQFALTISK